MGPAQPNRGLRDFLTKVVCQIGLKLQGASGGPVRKSSQDITRIMDQKVM